MQTKMHRTTPRRRGTWASGALAALCLAGALAGCTTTQQVAVEKSSLPPGGFLGDIPLSPHRLAGAVQQCSPEASEPTPRIDALAREGMKLLNFAPETQCTPSRSALTTGRYSI